jgi:hypothetical protein
MDGLCNYCAQSLLPCLITNQVQHRGYTDEYPTVALDCHHFCAAQLLTTLHGDTYVVLLANRSVQGCASEHYHHTDGHAKHGFCCERESRSGRRTDGNCAPGDVWGSQAACSVGQFDRGITRGSVRKVNYTIRVAHVKHHQQQSTATRAVYSCERDDACGG